MLSSKFSKLLILQAMCKCPYKLSVNVKLVCQRTGKAWVVQHVLINPKRAPFFCITCIEIEARYFSFLSGFKCSRSFRAVVDSAAGRLSFSTLGLWKEWSIYSRQEISPAPRCCLQTCWAWGTVTHRRQREGHWDQDPDPESDLLHSQTLRVRWNCLKRMTRPCMRYLGRKRCARKLIFISQDPARQMVLLLFECMAGGMQKMPPRRKCFFFFTVIKKPSVRGGLSGGRNGMQSRQFSVRVPVKSDVTVRYRYARLYCFGQVLF